MATAASAATVSMTSTPAVIRTQVQGAGTYNILDFFLTNAVGNEFTNYTITGLCTTGTFADPARLQDSRQINPAAAGQDGNTAGEVDMWANTVWSSAGKIDLGLDSTILPDPGGYGPTGTGAAPAFTNFKWDVFDNVGGDDNNLADDPDNGTAATAPYHLMRVLTSVNGVGTINFIARETVPGSGVSTNSVFDFDFGIGANVPPVITSDAGPNQLGQIQTVNGQVITHDFDVVDPDDLVHTWSATLGTFVPLFAGAVDNSAAATIDSNGTFSWATLGAARGAYNYNIMANDGEADSNVLPYLVTVTVVPEPSTLALFGLAMVGAMGFVRRRNS